MIEPRNTDAPQRTGTVWVLDRCAASVSQLVSSSSGLGYTVVSKPDVHTSANMLLTPCSLPVTNESIE
ncbi:hypothetical protein EA472_13020 [Natrarchaeobius oligotrophus]|uniref:Uncharacterized protein n=1 Tax=Natrarchaeobius chitinivorans TaxID=1679083 RepID=A0A3N6M7H5_NATCH|nr:hypothetical protein EA472_13020 [Natrarchaeobius chitinivorans]